MIRKLFIRLFLLCALITGVVILTLGAAGYMALQEPAFYGELRSQTFSRAEELAAETTFKLMERELQFWAKSSLQRQQLKQDAALVSLTAGVEASAADYDPTKDLKSISITQDQLNTVLAPSKAAQKGDWRNPRVRVSAGRIDLALEVVSPQVSCILSIELRPSLLADGRLRLDLLSARVGRLPLPIQTVLQWLPHEVNYIDKDLELNLTAQTPHLCWKLPQTDRQSPSLKSLECQEGKLAVQLIPPILELTKTKPAMEPVALSSRN